MGNTYKNEETDTVVQYIYEPKKKRFTQRAVEVIAKGDKFRWADGKKFAKTDKKSVKMEDVANDRVKKGKDDAAVVFRNAPNLELAVCMIYLWMEDRAHCETGEKRTRLREYANWLRFSVR